MIISIQKQVTEKKSLKRKYYLLYAYHKCLILIGQFLYHLLTINAGLQLAYSACEQSEKRQVDTRTAF